MYRRVDEETVIERLKAKTKPDTLAAIFQNVHAIRLSRQIPWTRIVLRINREVKPILDKYGVVGAIRPMYYDYWRSLWKFLSKYTENVWDRYIEAVRYYYINAHQLNPRILDEITDVMLKTIREIVSEVVGGGGGGEKTGDSDSGEAVGEAKRD